MVFKFADNVQPLMSNDIETPYIEQYLTMYFILTKLVLSSCAFKITSRVEQAT